MMDWTDRHCRYLHRLIAPRARLYTEMVHVGAVLFGEPRHHLDFDPAERPLALQLGGSEPRELARAVRIAAEFGYDEINLNCGCPSDRVQAGRFGACLMAEPVRVAEAVAAMQAATALPVTVKCRIGIDDSEEFDFFARFVAAVAAAGCRTFVVHARKAWLKGLSPKENREVPPLRYEVVHRLKRSFPALEIVVNGGIRSPEAARAQLARVDGVMIGREAYENPYALAAFEQALFEDAGPAPSREAVLDAMIAYAAAQQVQGVPLRRIAKPMLGLFNGLPGARAWRRRLSLLEPADGAASLREAAALVGPAGRAAALRSASAVPHRGGIGADSPASTL